jgi:hypothetical protein
VKRNVKISNWLSFAKIFVILGKKITIGSAALLGVKAYRCNMSYRNWQGDLKLNSTNIVDFKLVSAFCRSNSEYGGSVIWVKDGLDTEEICYFVDIMKKKFLKCH